MDYRDAIVWRKSMRLAAEVIRLSRRLPRDERFGIRSQLTRAATSLPSNIAEGWLRESKKEKVRFLAIAHGSLAELHTQLLLCIDVNWLPLPETTPALGLVDEVARMLTALKRRWRPASKASKAATPTLSSIS